MKSLTLKPQRSRSVLHHHPWIFSGAVAKADDAIAAGDVVDVVSHDGAWLARGIANPQSELTVRLMTWNPEEIIDEENVQARVHRAAQRRSVLPSLWNTQAYRLIFGESDGLPGLIVDKYAAYLVVQIFTPAMERWREVIVQALVKAEHPQGIYERSDLDTREREKLSPRRGVIFGEEPPDLVEVQDDNLQLLIDIKHGQKTGLYLDQRENRPRVAKYCQGASVVNAFSYSGAFGLASVKSGAAEVINLDTSERALSLAEQMYRINQPTGRLTNLCADVFFQLRRFRDEGRTFDVIILDPPKFAFTKSMISKATRAYKDINLLAVKLLRPGGYLATFSCSGHVTPELFQQIVQGAGLDAGREVLILEKLTQPPDHPVLLTFPESEYLKGLVGQVV